MPFRSLLRQRWLDSCDSMPYRDIQPQVHTQARGFFSPDNPSETSNVTPALVQLIFLAAYQTYNPPRRPLGRQKHVSFYSILRRHSPSSR